MMRVLIVEDEPPILSLLDDFFGSEGFDRILAASAQHGVELAVSERPDVVLMDMVLPDLDGASATRMLKRDPRTREIPVVAMSANLTLLERVRDLPADEIVSKPFDLDKLLGIVRANAARQLEAMAGD